VTGITFIGDAYEYTVNRIGMYSDSTTMVKLDTPDTLEEIVANAHSVLLQPRSMSDLMAGLSVVDGLWNVFDSYPQRLILPYVPGARQDRANPSGDVGFMLATVARLINSYGFMEVVVADPHSPKVNELINNVVEFPLVNIYAHLWKGYTGVISADKGGLERATLAAKVLDKPLYQGAKVRDEATGKLTGFAVEPLEEGGHYLVVDDICDGGGTFLGLGEKIREQGAYADLFVTHGIFSKGTDDLKKIFKNIYTTNTRSVHERNDVLTLDIMTEMRNHR
jgi:ribose-phosphate pyrophosphokinase